jgi:phosphoribosylamine--glycine ligase
MKTVLVVGSGGREHALAWKLSTSSQVARVIVVPGNDGMPTEWERWPMPVITHQHFAQIAERARAENVSLAVIGPDNPLASGIVDVFEAQGILTFGPSAKAARLEASKSFAKEVMRAARVPTAKYFEAHSLAEAEKMLAALDWKSGWVIKADGLALGKGVYVCDTLKDAQAAMKSFEALGLLSHWVIEEKLSGEEISWMAFCDGKRVSLLEPARDYKRVRDGDEGPNTGGMGALSPIPGVPAAFSDRVRKEVFEPTLKEMAQRGTPFKGVLYAGLMVDFEQERLMVLEFNARFGDPETQVLLARMDADLYTWCEAVAKGDLSALPVNVPFSKNAAVVVVGAAPGYPEQPEKGAEVFGLPEPRATNACPTYFIAGATRQGARWVVSGGRVLGAMGMGLTLEAARSEAYAGIQKIQFHGMHYRSDIGR